MLLFSAVGVNVNKKMKTRKPKSTKQKKLCKTIISIEKLLKVGAVESVIKKQLTSDLFKSTEPHTEYIVPPWIHFT